ncbi:MAG: hypothetical protein KAQ65_02085 [Candidatus Thorarchaeota archaeon]|nr:hypothetical protein [Candidatus Thorarchaeota archaeon]
MSSGDVKGLIDSSETENVKVIGTCPCFSSIDGKPVCLNGDTIEDIDALGVHPEIIESSNGFSSWQEDGHLPLCHKAVHVNGSDEAVTCVTRQIPIRIRKRNLTKSDLSEALELFPSDMFSSEQELCTECLYNVIAATYEEDDSNSSM